jgi:hypothetical protein
MRSATHIFQIEVRVGEDVEEDGGRQYDHVSPLQLLLPLIALPVLNLLAADEGGYPKRGLRAKGRRSLVHEGDGGNDKDDQGMALTVDGKAREVSNEHYLRGRASVM